jgi:Tn3 transposase DDE domain
VAHRSEMRPDTLHADPPGPAEPVLGWASLLALQLMPRLRTGKYLTLDVPSEPFVLDPLEHRRALLSGTIAWTLIPHPSP